MESLTELKPMKDQTRLGVSRDPLCGATHELVDRCLVGADVLPRSPALRGFAGLVQGRCRAMGASDRREPRKPPNNPVSLP